MKTKVEWCDHVKITHLFRHSECDPHLAVITQSPVGLTSQQRYVSCLRYLLPSPKKALGFLRKCYTTRLTQPAWPPTFHLWVTALIWPPRSQYHKIRRYNLNQQHGWLVVHIYVLRYVGLLVVSLSFTVNYLGSWMIFVLKYCFLFIACSLWWVW